MKFINKLFLFLFTLTLSIEAANVNVTTYYGNTGGIVGILNTTTQVVNGRTICPVNPTIGCDFGDDPLFSNNGTVNNASDDSYSGDLVVRTNDSFQAIAGWTWNGEAGGSKEKVTIKGTLPSTGILPNGSTGETKSYKWDTLPGSCLADESSISEDKQIMTCVRYAFDKNDVGTYSEDLPFNIIVKGETLSKTEPGDVSFEISAEDATTVSDDTDGYSLTVTAAPRWNLQKSYYTTLANREIDGVRGWVLDYKFYIEVDEVSGEIDNASALVGNESMGKDATFTFKDDLSEVSPNAKLIGCSFKGRYTNLDGYVGSADPLTYNGTGSIWGDSYPERKIPQTADEREISCTQTGTIIDVTAKHIDATLTNYPKLDYRGYALPVNRGIAAIGSIYVFVPLDDVKPKRLGGNNEGENAGINSEAGGWLTTKNRLTNFDPITPTGNANFGGERESEKDNSYALTLYYNNGSWDKYYRGTQNSFTGPAHISYYIGSTYRSGDGIVNANTEFSTWMVSSNTGGTPKTKDIHCDVIDAYRLEIQPIKDNTNYEVIKTQYYGKTEWPYRFHINSGSGAYINDINNFPYTVEYANTYVDNSFLPSQGGDTSADVGDTIVTECTDPSVKWYSSLEDARSGIDGGLATVTKIRYTLKEGIEMPPASSVYLVTNHKVRTTDLETGQPLENGDLIVDYATHSWDDINWHKPTYKPGVYPGTHSGTAGDRVIFSGPKARIIKDVDKVALSAGDEATFNLKISFTNDTGLEAYGNVKVTDLLPKGLKYVAQSVSEPYLAPVIGTCADVEDINSTDTPCNDAENQVLIWDLGERRAGEIFPDINYSTIVGVEVNAGTIRNVAKIEAPTDASPISQRRSEVGMSVSIPASINIVKSTEENVAYPSLRERTTTAQNINFVMDMRNGKAGDITDLDVIDILPFEGDAEEGAIKFNNLELKRKVATSFHGTSIYESMELIAHPLSSSACDLTANGGVKYYYTDADPSTINIAPTVGDANIIGGANAIWCEGEGCVNKEEVTAVRARGPRMEAQAICQLKVSLSVKDNLAGDNYSNSAGASATGITLPVLSNSLAIPVVGSSLGDYVWYDKNANGIQDDSEKGMQGITVKLLDGSGMPVKNPANPTEDYIVTTNSEGKYNFTKLNSGEYIVEFVRPTGYLISDANTGTSAIDSNIVDKINSRTAAVTLGVDEKELDVDAGFYTPVIAGTVFDDGNNDGTVNGKPINTPDGSPLYVTLLDANNSILASKAVASDGTYSFDGDDNVTADANYKVILATTIDATVASLPVNWNNADGEHIGTGAGLDGSNDGKIAVSVEEADVLEVNFGINKKPEVVNVSEPEQFNPSGTIKVDVPDLNVSDEEDGTPTTITIETVPSNAKLYYNDTLVVAGEVIENFDNSLLTIDPDAGDQSISFEYTTTDKVGVTSDRATVTMSFKDLKVSGNLYIDGNGDENINGTKTSSADGVQLYATLVTGGSVISSMPLSASGTYLFDIEDGVRANTEYTVVLSDSNGSVNASLPTEWSNEDGENISSITPTGNDGAKDGLLTVKVMENDVTKADFGINKKPVAENVSEPAQANPGNASTVQVPDLNISDAQTSTGLSVTITSNPNNATIYYNGNEVTIGQEIPNFDNTLLTLDPENGDQNVSFTYTTTDGAGTESDEATVSLEFTNIIISGTLYNDGNGNGNVDGNETNSADTTQLFVTLVDAGGIEVASKALASDGTYRFDSVDGISSESNYTIVLTNALHKLTASLPATWNNADGENIGLIGLDGKADGSIFVEVLKENIPEINFGINKQPIAKNRTENTQFNPGGTTQVTVPPLEISDKEDGEPTTVTITELPTNGTLYYDGVPVVLDANITDVNVSKFTLDPHDGDISTSFKYTTTDRVGVISEPATVTMPFVGLKISGNIFNDGDNDGTINGTGIPAPDGKQLYVTLIDKNSSIVASHPVNSNDGSYLFSDTDGIIANSNYTVVLSTSENKTTASLPTNWSNQDGEHIGINAGTDGSNDGLIEVAVFTENIEEVNFGINKKPVANDVVAPPQLNLGGDTQVDVPDLVVSDNEDSTPSTVTIVNLPLNGTLYYNGTPVTAGEIFTDFNNSLLTIDPNNGDVTLSFTYTTTDAVGDESEPATVSMQFDGLEIRGNIFNDGNNDNTVNGTKIAQIASTALYATLLDDSNTVMATTAIEMDGSYKFTGLDGIIPNTNYLVVLSIEANTTTSTLVPNWNWADGEHVGTNEGLDDKADGKILVNVLEVDVLEVNFGVNEQPVANNKTKELQFNPGGTTQVTVPPLEISDKEDGEPTTVTITELPTNGTLYYDGVPVVLDANITDVNVSKFSLDPHDGDVTTVFKYTTTDRVGVISEPATVTMPFVGLKISGNIFNDGDNDGTINGTGIPAPSGVQLYVTLIDDNNTVVASKEVTADGSYAFGDTDGLKANSDYKVILSTTENNTTASL
ncbi:MAG: Conserved repeat domain protein, partial [uncultured Sulfurovum sp.]